MKYILERVSCKSFVCGQLQTTSKYQNIFHSLVLSRFKNGDIIEYPNAASESYLIDNLTINDVGTYTCRVENEFGAVYSEPATLSVIGKVIFLLHGKPGLLILNILNAFF